MLDDNKKRKERDMAVLTAAAAKEKWSLVDSESPDFVVSDPSGSFGLEVTSCFSDVDKKGSSVAVQGAQYRQKKLYEIRGRCIARFPGVDCWSLDYINDWKDDDVEAHIISAIKSALEDTANSSFYFPISEYRADETAPLSRPMILINKQPNPLSVAWINTTDHAGPLKEASVEIQDTIKKKANKLDTYRQKCPAIRLLVVAYSLMQSGNLSIKRDFSPDLYGFDKVYFMNFPNYVVEFPSRTVYPLTGHTSKTLS